MKPLTALLLLFFTTALVRGAEDITTILSPDGRMIDLVKLQDFVLWVQPCIHDYPTHFKDDDEKKRITTATAKVTEEIKSINPAKFDDVKLLTTLGYVLAMGHNIELRTFPYARAYFERALAVDPDDARTNLLYGMLLIGTDRYHFEALPYLQKALAQGEREAQIPIGMLYYQKGDKQKALEQIKAYSNARPADFAVGQLYKAMLEGTLKFDQPLNKEESKEENKGEK